MKRFHLLIVLTLYGCSQILDASSTAALSHVPTAPIHDPQDTKLLEKLLDETLAPWDRGEYILEHITQILNTDAKGRYNKEEGIPSIKMARNAVQKMRDRSYGNLNETILYNLNERFTVFISYLATILDSRLQLFPSLDLQLETIGLNTNKKPIQITEVEEQIKRNKIFIDILYQEADNAGLSFMNKLVRKFERFDSKAHLSTIIKKSLPYLGIFTWVILMTDEETIDQLGSTLLSSLKGKLGGTPVEETEETVKHIAEEEALKHIKTQQQSAQADATAQNPEPKRGERKLSKRKVLKERPGLIGTPLYALNNLIHFKVEPLITVALGKLLIDYVQEDIKDLNKWRQKKWEVVHNNLRGSQAPTRGPIDTFKPRITFDDLVGLDDAKDILSDVVRYICDPERYERSGTAIGKGYLLAGPTRTGKTFIAEALAGEINKALIEQGRPDKCGFKEVKWWDLMQKDGIKSVIESAKKDAPCVLFIDEIDTLRLKREGDAVTLSEFLTGMSGLNRDDKNRVILLAATNRIEHLDQALLQPGRFGTIIHFENPRLNDRKKFFEISLHKLTIDLEQFDTLLLAQATENASFGDLEAIVRYAQFKAKTVGERLAQKHLEDAINHKTKHIMNFNIAELTAQERHILAIHQTGHAFAYLLLNPQQQLQSVTICAISKIREKPLYLDLEENKAKRLRNKSVKYGKIFTFQKHEILQLENAEEKKKICKIHLAGHIAEEMLSGSRDHHYHKKDRQRAFEIAKDIVFSGIQNTKDNISDQTRQELLQQAYDLVQTLENEMRDLLCAHFDELKLIADTLEQKQTLSAQEIQQLLHPQVATAHELEIMPENPNKF